MDAIHRRVAFPVLLFVSVLVMSFAPVQAPSTMYAGSTTYYWSKNWFVISYGQTFSTATPLPGNSVNYYWNTGGPCYQKSPCYIDTLNVILLNGSWVESVTAYGRFWNYDLYTKAQWSSNGSALNTVARYAQYPCGVFQQPPDNSGQNLSAGHQGYSVPACFSGRGLYFDGTQLIEDISNYVAKKNGFYVDRHWVFDAKGNFIRSYDISYSLLSPGGGRSRP